MDNPSLRQVSDDLLAALDRLRELEAEKRSLTPGTRRFLDVAHAVARLGRQAVDQSEAEEELAEAAATRLAEGRPPELRSTRGRTEAPS